MKIKIIIILAVMTALSACSSERSTSSPPQSQATAPRTAPVAAGEMAPDFTLEDQQVREVTLSASRGKNPVVLVFYRGHWWPHCARQLAELRSLLKPDEAVSLYAISVDGAEKGRDFAGKIAADGRGDVRFPLLSDPQHRTIDAYGLRDPAYAGQKEEGIPSPAVYVIDKTGRVAWSKVEADYRKRPTNAEIRAALDSLKWFGALLFFEFDA